jgi:hypothetical protein
MGRAVLSSKEPSSGEATVTRTNTLDKTVDEFGRPLLLHLLNAVIRATNIVDAEMTMTVMSQVSMMNLALIITVLLTTALLITVLKIKEKERIKRKTSLKTQELVFSYFLCKTPVKQNIIIKVQLK